MRALIAEIHIFLALSSKDTIASPLPESMKPGDAGFMKSNENKNDV
jgi:hypothetical protein